VLNLWHIISKICTIAVFVIVDSQRVCCTEFVGIFMIYLHVTFHVPSCNFPFVIVVSPSIEISEGLFSYIISQLFMKWC